MTEELLKGNKLIAKFKGYKLCYLDSITKKYPYYNHNDKYIKPKAVIRLDRGENLEFHTNMNWLYPVYQKIYHYMLGEFTNHIDSLPLTTDLLKKKFNDVECSISSAEDVKLIFDKIVEWIETYNTIKQ